MSMTKTNYKCAECDEWINGDVFIPEDNGAMDRECWKEWVAEQ